MTILGIDPGIGRTGWGVLSVEGSNLPAGKAGLKVKSYGCIETPAHTLVEDRLVQLYQNITHIIETEKPDTMGIEELFFNTNAKTAMVVGQARGVVLLAAAQKKLPIGIYTPLQVKIAVTGFGRAEKAQVGQMVKVLLNLPKVPKPDDTADALAIAITHAFSYKVNKLK